MQELYRRYGQRVYARAAADPAFSAAIASREEAIRAGMRRMPRWTRLTRKTAVNGYLLGHAHALLERLLDAAVDAEASDTPATMGDRDSVMVCLGALFQLAFAGGLLTVQAPAHR